MVRRLSGGEWKALVLIAVAAGGLLWHVLACMESPMSFAPNGDLAFTTMEPYDGDANDIALRGTRVYRLMVLPAGMIEPKVLEESSDWMISAPTFSPDGRKIAYLRIPLLSREELAGIVKTFESNTKTRSPCTQPVEYTWPSVVLRDQGANATTRPSASKLDDRALPSLEKTQEFTFSLACVPTVPTALLERDAATGELTSATEVRLPLAPVGEGGFSTGLLLAYVLNRLQYSPDSQWVYICPGSTTPINSVVAVNVSTKDTRVIATQAAAASLSPDGRTLATLLDGCVGFARTDGSLTSYVRWEKETSLAGLVWANNHTTALLCQEKVKDKDSYFVSFMKTDGTVARTVTLPEVIGKEGENGNLALAPDGRTIVVAFEKATYFLDSSGRILGSWNHEQDSLAQPTFTPDGKQVAFKYMKVQKDGKKETGRAESIIFFSPTGREIRRVTIPPAKRPQMQPATVEVPPEHVPALEPAIPPAAPQREFIQPHLEQPPPVPPTVPRRDIPVETPSTQPSPAPGESAEPTTEPAIRPEQKEALEELRPELP